MKAQRLRVTFARGDAMKYISHLDVMRFWERALRRAQIPVAHSEGFSPHAQIALAAPLAVGMTSEAELMDVFLEQPMQPREFIRQLSDQIPQGISISSAQEVGLALPSMQADMQFAEYLVGVPATTTADGKTVSAAVEEFLAAHTIAWEHKRENETRSYDIRAQVETIEVAASNETSTTLTMRLKNDNSGSGRPEQIVAALGLQAPTRVHRTKLILASQSKALDAWRKSGRPEA